MIENQKSKKIMGHDPESLSASCESSLVDVPRIE